MGVDDFIYEVLFTSVPDGVAPIQDSDRGIG